MKIILFCPSLRREKGGLEAVFRRLHRGLSQHRHEVHAVYRGSTRELTLDGSPWEVRLEHPQTRYKLPKAGSVARFIQDVYRLHRLLGRIQPDIVNCHFASFYALYFLLLKPLHRYKIVVSVHGTDVTEGINDIQRLVRPWILRGADHVTAVSSALESAAQRCAGKPLPSSVIYNGLDVDYWSDEPEASNGCVVDTKPIITNVGALRRVKGQDVLLHAFARLRNSGLDAQLWLVGDGPRQEELENLCRQLGIEGDVQFHGWCARDRVREILYATTVFAFPSRSEGFGIAVLEAMATGTPVVASAVGGLPEILTAPNHGKLVPPQDSQRLARTLEEVLRRPKMRRQIARGGRLRAQDFRWESMINRYEELFLSFDDRT
jgi:glycosyltransferase involved in cell wall biosynthesis